MQVESGIRLFILASQQGSFAAVGRHVGLSTASVSRQIAALESHLKVRLFNRGARALTLTEAGKILLTRARPLFEELDETVDSLSLLEAAPRGLLRVSVRAIAASSRLIPALPRFLAAHPEVRIDLIISSDENVDLVAENIDVDIRYTRPDRSDLVARLLAPTRLVLVAAPAYLSKQAQPKTPEDLAGHQVILPVSHPTYATWTFSDANGGLHETRVEARFRVDDGIGMRGAIRAGIGIGMMPLEEVDLDLASGVLVHVLDGYAITAPRVGSEGLFAVYQKTRYQTGKLRSFLAFLDQAFREPAVHALP